MTEFGYALSSEEHTLLALYIHQVDTDQGGFFRFYQRAVLPSVVRETVGARA